MKIYLLNFTLAIWICASATAQDDFETKKNQIDKAHQNITLIRQNFKKALQKAIQDKGVSGALGECKIMAPQLGIQGETLEVGRTSHKLRNASNKPRDWVKPVLDKYVKTPKSQHEPYQIVNLGPKHYGYVEPIYVEAVCLNCHGSQLSPGVKKEISQLYPQDSATGFQIGDLRGLIWLESKSP